MNTAHMELATRVAPRFEAPGFVALAFKASRGIDDIYELTCIRNDGSRFPVIVPARRMVMRISADNRRCRCFGRRVSFP
jgi:hypothetical protein